MRRRACLRHAVSNIKCTKHWQQALAGQHYTLVTKRSHMEKCKVVGRQMLAVAERAMGA